RTDYPFYAAAQLAFTRREPERRGLDVDAAFRSVPDAPAPSREVSQLVSQAIGSDERWDVEFPERALPWLRLPPAGTWRYRGAIDVELWRKPLPPVHEGTRHLVRRTLAAF